jgi:hypothetical protein
VWPLEVVELEVMRKTLACLFGVSIVVQIDLFVLDGVMVQRK